MELADPRGVKLNSQGKSFAYGVNSQGHNAEKHSDVDSACNDMWQLAGKKKGWKDMLELDFGYCVSGTGASSTLRTVFARSAVTMGL